MAAHRYWRLLCPTAFNGGPNVSVGEAELRTSAGGANLALLSNGGTFFASSVFSAGYSANRAFDGDNGNSYWLDDAVFPRFIARDFGVGVAHDITHLTIFNPGSPANCVLNFSFQWSDDGTAWTTSFSGTVPNNVANASSQFVYVAPILGNAFLYSPFISTQRFDATLNAYVAVIPPASPLAAFGGATAALLAPRMSLVAFGGGAVAALLAPRATISAFGGSTAKLVSASPTLSANGHDSSGENAFAGVAPIVSLAFSGGANANLTAPRPVLSVSATFTAIGRANLTAPKGTLQASGTTGGAASASLRAPMGKLVGHFGAVASITTTNSPTLVASGTANPIGSAALQAPMATLVGYSGAVCSITLTGKPTLQATGTTGNIGKSAVICPLFDLTASGTVNKLSSANLIAPSPRLTGTSSVAYLIAPGAVLTAIGTAVVAVAYEAYSVNLTHKARTQDDQSAIDEVTRYTNFPFTQIVRYQNSYFGVAADGLYLLEGTTDNGAPIAYAVKTCADDFKESQNKTIVSAYFAGRIGPTMTVNLHAGETGQNTYAYSTPRGAGIQNHREKFGRGVKDRYFALGVSGVDLLEIDSVELEINTLSRKI